MSTQLTEPEDPKGASASRSGPNWLTLGLILFATLISLLPILLGLPAPAHARGPLVLYVVLYGPAIAAVGLCYFLDRTTDRKQRRDTLLLCVVLALLINYLHLWLVDNASYVTGPNLALQQHLHEQVVVLSPDALPHSYRFLPNSFIRLVELVTGDFATARDSYRNLFGVLLLYAIYRFARLFLRHGGALFCLAIWTAITPVSFRYYAGQPADPLSHLSFILSFIFLETEQFVYLLSAVLIGTLAKETVAAMSGYYLLFSWRDPGSRLRAVILFASVILLVAGVRALVLPGAPGYTAISGVDPTHLSTNWNNYLQWVRPILFTVGIFVPFVILGWRSFPWRLRSLVLYLGPLLFFSSLFFSWLREGRNFMPLAAILIVMTVYYLLPYERAPARSGLD
jgi:hypothetical protein